MRRSFQFLFACGLLLAARDVFAAENLTNISAVLALSVEEARRGPAVDLEAVVTYSDPSRRTYFVHDGAAGCFLSVPAAMNPRSWQFGDRISIRGVAEPGGYLPQISGAEVRALGSGAEPRARAVTAEELFSTLQDAQWVEVEGRVTGVQIRDGGPAIDLNLQGWNVQVMLPRGTGQAVLPWHLAERRVRVRAVAGTLFNEQRQMTGRFLYVPDLAHVVPLDGEIPPPSVASSSFSDLMRPRSDAARLLRVIGTVTHVVAGRGLYLRSIDGAMFVRTAQPLALVPGDEVEATGVAQMEPFRPALRATGIRKLGSLPTPKPLGFDASETRRTIEHHELVAVEAELLAVREGPDDFTLQCRAGQESFPALLDKALAQRLPPDLAPGSRLFLTGICELRSSRFLYSPAWVDGFRLHLRSPADIAVLARPSWWTAPRLAWAIGGLLALALAVAAWAVLLRRRVAAQTAIIRDKITRETVLSERERIARDWHDTIEQQLMGVTMLLDDGTARLTPETSPAAAERFRLASRMVDYCREESRASIRDLHSRTLEERGLPGAVEEYPAALAGAAGLDFSLQVTGTPLPLPVRTGQELLRIAQEAVANTARHARARSAAITLHYDAASVTLSVRDDGCGFDPADTPDLSGGNGHFGLAGMRERARKLQATLEIHSTPNSGTIIRCTVPFSSGTA